jgi:hypothetical protein
MIYKAVLNSPLYPEPYLLNLVLRQRTVRLRSAPTAVSGSAARSDDHSHAISPNVSPQSEESSFCWLIDLLRGPCNAFHPVHQGLSVDLSQSWITSWGFQSKSHWNPWSVSQEARPCQLLLIKDMESGSSLCAGSNSWPHGSGICSWCYTNYVSKAQPIWRKASSDSRPVFPSLAVVYLHHFCCSPSTNQYWRTYNLLRNISLTTFKN